MLQENTLSGTYKKNGITFLIPIVEGFILHSNIVEWNIFTSLLDE